MSFSLTGCWCFFRFENCLCPSTEITLVCARTACVMQLYWNSLRFYWPFADTSLPMKNVCVSVLVVSTGRVGGIEIYRRREKQKRTVPFQPPTSRGVWGTPQIFVLCEGCEAKRVFYSSTLLSWISGRSARRKKITYLTRSHCEWKIHKPTKRANAALQTPHA